MERFYKFLRDSKGFEGILRDLKGRMFLWDSKGFEGMLRVFKGRMFRYSKWSWCNYCPQISLNIPKYPLISLITLLLLPSCDVGDYIGDRFGRWQITTIQTPDSIATPTDLFYDFQSKVHIAHVLYEEEHRTLDLHGLARQEGDSLFIKYLPMDSTGNTMREFISKRFLIEDDYTDVRFHILRLDGSRMILERGNRRWELRAY